MARAGTPKEGRKIGKPVQVICDPVDPREALVNTFTEKSMPVVTAMGSGGGLLVGAVEAAMVVLD